jgi:hypothetical protein
MKLDNGSLARRMASEINERGGNGKDKRKHFSKAKHLVFQ